MKNKKAFRRSLFNQRSKNATVKETAPGDEGCAKRLCDAPALPPHSPRTDTQGTTQAKRIRANKSQRFERPTKRNYHFPARRHHLRRSKRNWLAQQSSSAAGTGQ